MKSLVRYPVLFILLLFISACSSVPEESAISVERQLHQSLLSQIHAFQARGKIGYRGPDETVTLNFHWKHNPGISELKLINFLGSTVLTMTMTGKGAEVITSDKETFRDADANLLFMKLTGMAFPVTQMKDWLKGQPTDVDSYSFNETNTLASLTKQSGNQKWTLSYDRYQDVDSFPMPYQMTLNKEDTRVKIVVSKWILN